MMESGTSYLMKNFRTIAFLERNLRSVFWQRKKAYNLFSIQKRNMEYESYKLLLSWCEIFVHEQLWLERSYF